MNDLLEPILRETLEKRADQLDPEIRRRLVSLDYRPRRRRVLSIDNRTPHRRVRLLSALGAAGVAGLALALALIITLGSNPTEAFAGWSPTPTLPRPGQTPRALGKCGGHPVLVDTRGPFTASVYSRSHGEGICLIGPQTFFSGSASNETPALRAGQIEVFAQTVASGQGEAATMLDGRLGKGVTRVQIQLSDGRVVRATVAHGWYLAWWPGKPHATLARITTAHGIQTRALPASATGSAGSCGGPPGSGCASEGPGAAVGG